MAKSPNPTNGTQIKLIVGLGNPGSEYALTRHNAGYWFVEKICEQYHGTLNLENKFKGCLGKVSIAGQPCLVFQPITYMNLSGQALQLISRFYKIPLANCLVVHDDLDLPAGAARLKFDGGHGGHNGLRDIFSQSGTKEFFRLRLGIGHPQIKSKVLDYVLQRPSKSDQALILNAIDASMDALPDMVQGNIEKAMNQLHTVTKPS